jgi:NTP pyrophosphatase (non-canonical NTP hydrolase)
MNVKDQGIVTAIDELISECYGNSERHGFWNDYFDTMAVLHAHVHLQTKYVLDTKLHKHALITSEIGECIEGVRKPCADSHCPAFTSEEVELADAVIRILDYAGAFQLRLAEALLAKMRYNATRPHMHNKGA